MNMKCYDHFPSFLFLLLLLLLLMSSSVPESEVEVYHERQFLQMCAMVKAIVQWKVNVNLEVNLGKSSDEPLENIQLAKEQLPQDLLQLKLIGFSSSFFSSSLMASL